MRTSSALPASVPATTPTVIAAIRGQSAAIAAPSLYRYAGRRAASTISATIVAVPTKASRRTSNPSIAAARIPPWLPTSPPKNPDRAPAAHAAAPRNRIRVESPVTPAAPAKMSSPAKTHVSHALFRAPCSIAPASPPAALVSPKLRTTRQSTARRSCQKRTALAIACGMVTAATAARIPVRRASTGVSRLPTPKPATEAIAPAAAATPTSTRSKSVMHPRRDQTLGVNLLRS
jgi:hypothetical protein